MTRQDRANQLLRRLQKGPSFGWTDPANKSLTREEANSQARAWIETWVLDDVLTLVPELRKTQC
jgi:hypothetical protein